MTGGEGGSWTRSSFCASGTCVEVADGGDVVLVRDGKEPAGPVLEFTRAEWTAFLDGIEAGDFRFGEEVAP